MQMNSLTFVKLMYNTSLNLTQFFLNIITTYRRFSELKYIAILYFMPILKNIIL